MRMATLVTTMTVTTVVMIRVALRMVEAEEIVGR